MIFLAPARIRSAMPSAGRKPAAARESPASTSIAPRAFPVRQERWRRCALRRIHPACPFWPMHSRQKSGVKPLPHPACLKMKLSGFRAPPMRYATRRTRRSSHPASAPDARPQFGSRRSIRGSAHRAELSHSRNWPTICRHPVHSRPWLTTCTPARSKHLSSSIPIRPTVRPAR